MGEARDERRIESGLGARNKLPEVQPLVRAGADDVLAVRGEMHGRHFAVRLVQRVEPLAVRDAPELDRFVRAGRGEHVAGRMPCQVMDGAFVDVDRLQKRSISEPPQPDDAVVSRGGELRAVRRNLGVREHVAMLPEFADDRAAFRRADLRHTRQAGDAARHCQKTAVIGEMNRVHLVRQPAERGDHRARRHVKHVDRPAARHGEPRPVRRETGRRERRRHRRRGHGRNTQRPQNRFVLLRPGRSGRDPRAQNVDRGRRKPRLVLRRHRRFFQALHAPDHKRSRRVSGLHRVAVVAAPGTQRGKCFDGQAAFEVRIVVAAGAVAAQNRRHIRVPARRGGSVDPARA